MSLLNKFNTDFNKYFLFIVENNNLRSLVYLFFVLYGSKILKNPTLSNNIYLKLFIIFVILYSTNKNPIFSIIIAFIVLFISMKYGMI